MKKKMLYSFIIMTFLFFFVIDNKGQADSLILSDINYNESIEEINNPERGFYKTEYIVCNDTGCGEVTTRRNTLIHLRIGLKYYGIENNNTKFTEEMIESLKNILESYRANEANVIMRFAYDDFLGEGNHEPDIDTVLEHIKQLSPVFYEYEDVIMTIETSLIGRWGEQHGSEIVTKENISKIIDAYLENIPATMTISVRRPEYYAYWAGINYDDLYKSKALPNQLSYRVGVFNDGYLGSETDRGTFKKHPTLKIRENEVLWLENHALHTYYGGEVVASKSTTGIDYNKSNYAIEEMYRTHTTYLNSGWNQEVISSWKSDTYTEDGLYNGESSYIYISNHLGYRFVLNEAYMNESVYLNNAEKELDIKLKIENVGAANLLREKKAELIIIGTDYEYVEETNLDLRTVTTKDSVEFNISTNLSDEVKEGTYKVYLKVSSKNDNSSGKYSIRLANEEIWDNELKANYIGSFEITEEKKIEYTKYIIFPIAIAMIIYFIYIISKKKKINT